MQSVGSPLTLASSPFYFFTTNPSNMWNVNTLKHLGMLLAICLTTLQSQAIQIPVTTTIDNISGSLRLAIDSATPGDTITFDAGILDGIPIILTNGEITIDKSVVIMGNGSANTTIMATAGNRIFNLSDAGMVVLASLRLEGGQSTGNGGAILSTNTHLTLRNCMMFNNEADMSGGAIYHDGDSLFLDGCMIMDNEAHGMAAAQGGAGIFNAAGVVTIMGSTMIRDNVADGASGSGGGILNDAGATLSVMNSSIIANSSMRAGGGIEDVSGAGTTVTLMNVVLDSNMTSMAPGNGGGLHVTGAGDVSITGGTVIGNIAAAEGGGLWNGAGTMTVSGVMIEGNTASGASADQGGGGLYNLSGSLMITENTMIRNNVADGASGSGGGILNDAGATLSVMNSSIIANSSMRAGGKANTTPLVRSNMPSV